MAQQSTNSWHPLGEQSSVGGANGDDPSGRHAKVGKASFDHIYNQPDPRPYFQTLEKFGYEIPAHGQGMFSMLVAKRRQHTGRKLSVLDLCCSYGINAALLNHELTLDELYQRYRSDELASLSSEELAAADTAFYAEHRRESPVRVVGIDTAGRAVAYARRAGLLEAGSDENLELGDPSADLSRELSDVGLITVTGGVGYISERTFARVIGRMRSAPWVASFCLRWVSYDPVAKVLEQYGLVTEKLARTFPQRRFADDGERAYVLGELARMGLDTTDKEEGGSYHADFYLSRTAAEVRAEPLAELDALV